MKFAKILECAGNKAQNWSLASIFGQGLVTDALLGNPFSNLFDLGNSAVGNGSMMDAAVGVYGGGLGQGLLLPAFTDGLSVGQQFEAGGFGLVGQNAAMNALQNVAMGTGLQTINVAADGAEMAAETAGSWATGFGEIKFGYDLGSFAAAMVSCIW